APPGARSSCLARRSPSRLGAAVADTGRTQPPGGSTVSSVTRRVATLLLCAMVVLTAFAGSASGSPFDAARQRRERLAHRMARERAQALDLERLLERRIAHLESLVRSNPPRKIGVTGAQWRSARRAM